MADARIFQDLREDHDKHRQILERLGKTSNDDGQRSSLFEALRKELQAHATAEEESL